MYEYLSETFNALFFRKSKEASKSKNSVSWFLGIVICSSKGSFLEINKAEQHKKASLFRLTFYHNYSLVIIKIRQSIITFFYLNTFLGKLLFFSYI